jgi:hypothetical protein
MERRAAVKGELLCNQQHSRDAWADFRISVRRHRRLFRIHSIFKTMVVMLFLPQKRSLIPVSAQLDISFREERVLHIPKGSGAARGSSETEGR